jgi:soluble lytic murein transglycosylase
MGAVLIGLTCLGSGAALMVGRALLTRLQAAPTPDSSNAALLRLRHWSSDPERRREAALLLSGRPDSTASQRQRLLRGQGWGHSPLAAVVLKQAALAASAQNEPLRAETLWQQLLLRFPQQAASADALYSLGQRNPTLRRQLLQRFPAHPAALAAAEEQHQVLHLARWGPRWPGAEPLLRATCQRNAGVLTTRARQLLAAGLAQLGDGPAAMHCLGQASADAALQLSLAKALLRGSEADQQQADQLLLHLAQRQPRSAEAKEAAALLAESNTAEALTRLQQLPASLRQGAPVQARLALERQIPWQTVLRRWPTAPASWELQWQLAREALLKRQWPQLQTLLSSLDSRLLPSPLAARQLFWLGYAAQQQGRTGEARNLWQRLLAINPGGYYAWRARVRLGQAVERNAHQPSASRTRPLPAAPQGPWEPLASGDAMIDTLWRLGQPLEAWERWRQQRGGRAPQGAKELLVEGRLRTAIGDDWIGLGQLDQASVRLPTGSCASEWQRERQRLPTRFPEAFTQAAASTGVEPALLLAVARQESRFSPSVQSAVGAVGLLQLMPSTASELAGRPVPLAQLQDPSRNSQLGARYLEQLLGRWHNDLFLTVASYNAGPGAVQNWLGGGQPNLNREAELWVEAIPYPETRLYTKKVLGNLWSYRQGDHPPC